jgi:hypothetical protein
MLPSLTNHALDYIIFATVCESPRIAQTAYRTMARKETLWYSLYFLRIPDTV